MSINTGEQIVTSERPLSKNDFKVIQDTVKHGAMEAVKRMQKSSYPKPHPFETAPRWEIKGAPKTQEELEGKYAGYTFKDGTVVTRSPVNPESPRVVITDESAKGPDQAKKPTSWAPNTKVLAGAGIGTPLAGVLIWILGQFGVDMPWDVALYFAGLIIALVAYLVPEKKS